MDIIVPTDLSNGPTPEAPNTSNVNITPAQPQVEVSKTLKDMSFDELLKNTVKPASGDIKPIIFSPQQQSARYPNYYLEADNEDLQGKQQRWYSQLTNGIIKGGATAATSFVEGLMSPFDAGDAVFNGDTPYKNGLASQMDKWRDNLENVFPNYYTQWEQQHPFLDGIPILADIKGGSSSNFWADKIIKNAGFTVGAIGGALLMDAAIGAATGGIGEAPAVANSIGKLALGFNKLFATTDKLEEVINTAKMLNKSDDLIKAMKTAYETSYGASLSKKALDAGKMLAIDAGASHAEASIEAREGYNKVRQDLIDQYQRDNGTAPTGEELQKIEETATAAGNARYALNMALLMSSNAIQFPAILKGFRNTKGALKPLEDVAIKGGTLEGLNSISTVDKVSNVWTKLAKPVKGFFTEGVYEEGLQFAIDKGTEDYFTKKYSGEYKGSVNNIIDSTLKGLQAEFTTQEGLENVIIGGITGALFSPVESFFERRNTADISEYTKSAIRNISQRGLTGIFDQKYDSVAQSLKNNEQIKSAVENDDIFKFNNLKADEFYNWVSSGLNAGRFDVREQQLAMLKELPDEELNKVFGTDRTDNQAYVDKLIDKAHSIKDVHESLEAMFPNPYDLKTEKDAYLGFENYKNALGQYAYYQVDFNERTNEIAQKLAEIHPLLSADMVARFSDKRELNKIAEKYKQEAQMLESTTKDMSSADRINTNNRIKTLNTLAQKIKNNLNDNAKLAQLVPSLLSFEVNQTIPQGKFMDIVGYGTDLNRIKQEKEKAGAIYDNLFSEQGAKDFMEAYGKWASEPPVEQYKDTSVPEQVGDLLVNRTYTAEQKNKYRVKRTDSGYDLLSPNGDIVGTFTKEQKSEADAERNLRNKDLKSTTKFTVRAVRPDGRWEIEDEDRNIHVVDKRAYTNLVLEKTPEEELDEEAKKWRARKDLAAKFFAKQTILSSKNLSETPEHQDIAWETAKKELEQFSYTEANASDDWESGKETDITKRRRKFSNNYRFLSPEKKANLRIVRFTQKTEHKLGLQGIVNDINNNLLPQDKINNPVNGIIALVYITKESDGDYFVDVNGEKLSKVGEPISDEVKSKLILSTMHSAILKDSEGENRYRSNETQEDVEAFTAAWLKERENILNSDEVRESRFTYSNGIPVTYPKGSKERVPVTEALVNDEILRNNQVIFVSTGVETHNGQPINVAAGRPYLQYGDIAFELNNRLLTPHERDVVFKLLMEMAKEIPTGKNDIQEYALSYLRGLLFWNSEQERVGRNQMFVDKDLNLIIGNKNKSVPFTPANLLAHKQDIDDFLSLIYNSVNRDLLVSNEPFEEIYDVVDGEIKSFTWKNYQMYLTSPSYVLDQHSSPAPSSARGELPLYTMIRRVTNDPYDYNIKQKYAILQDIESPYAKIGPVEEIISNPLAVAAAQKMLPKAAKQISAPDVISAEMPMATGGVPITYRTTNGVHELVSIDTNSQAYQDLAQSIRDYNDAAAEDPALVEAVINNFANEYLKTISVENVSIPTGKINYVTKSGNKVSYKDGQLQITNSAGKPVSKSTERRIIDELSRDYNFDYGNDYTPNKTYSSSRDEAIDIINNSENPLQIAQVYNSEDRSTPRLTSIQSAIHNFGPFVTTVESYRRFGDINTISDIKKSYISKNATETLDQIAKEISDNTGVNVEPQDLVDFMHDFPKGVHQAERLNLSDIALKAADKFEELTGLPLTEKILNNILKRKTQVAEGPFSNPLLDRATAVANMREAFSKRNPEDTAYSRVMDYGGERITPEDIKAFEDYMSKNLPQIPVNIIDQIIQINPNEQAWGMYRDNMITLYKNAKKGTEYHEYFEAVWNSFLTPQEQNAVLEEERAKAGSFKDYRGKNAKYQDATDLQLKEHVADQYSEYVRGKSPSSFLGKVVEFFKRIAQFLKNIVRKPGAKEELFSKAHRGGFRTSTPVNASPAYSAIAPYSETDTHYMVQDYVATLFMNVFSNNKSLFDVENIQSVDVINKIRAQYVPIIGEEAFIQLTDKVKTYLNQFSITFDEDNVISINDEGYNRNDYTPEAFTVDVKKSSPYPVKLLLASLPRTDAASGKIAGSDVTKLAQSPIGGHLLVDSGRVFATLYDRLVGIKDVNDMAKRISQIASENSDFERLMTRLKITSTGEIDWGAIKSHDERLLTQMFSVFSKQRPTPYTMGMKEGNVYFYPSNVRNAVADKKTEWIADLKLTSPYFIKLSDGVMINNTIRNVSTANIRDKVKFLSSIGINFPKSIYDGLSPDKQKQFNDAVNGIKSHIKTETKFKTLNSWATLGVEGRISEIANILVQATTPTSDVSYFNLENKRVQLYAEGNAFSHFVDDYNNSEIEELKANNPRLNDSFLNNSLFMREKRPISWAYATGVRNEDTGKGTKTSKLTEADKFMQEFNHNMEGRYYTLVPADASTEYLVGFGHHINYSQFKTASGWNTTYNIFKGYLLDELTLVTEHSVRSKDKATSPRAKELRFFKGILSKSLNDKVNLVADGSLSPEDFISQNEAEITSSIRSFIDGQIAKTKANMEAIGVLKTGLDDSYSLPGIVDSFVSSKGVMLDKYSMKESDVNRLLTFSEINYIISNIELHKLVLGDPYQFEVKKSGDKVILDELKRIKSYTSPRKKITQTTEQDNFYNTQYNRGLNPSDLGYHTFKPYINTATVTLSKGSEDVVGSLYLKDHENPDYLKTSEADAQAWITLPTYREMMIKSGKWSDDAEKLYQWDMALMRSSLNKYSSESLRASDNKILSAKKPSKYKLSVLKPILTGSKFMSYYTDNVLDKMSQFPISYNTVKGTSLEKMYLKMLDEGVGYAIMPSGRKQGAEKFHNIYNPDGSFNTAPFSKESMVKVPWTVYGDQVENSFKEKKQTDGSQVAKLITVDFMENGIPIDIPKTIANNWPHMNEDEKLKASPLYAEVKHNDEIKRERIADGYSKLQAKLGIVDTGSGFEVVDKEKAYKAIKDEMLKREISDNALEAISFNHETGEFVLPFEATNAYMRIRDILWSYVDKSISSQKVSGSAKVQVSAAMWEKNNREAVYLPKGDKDATWTKVEDYNSLTEDEKATVRLTSNDLKFYTPEEPWCEMILPMWFRKQLKTAGIFQDNTDEEILEYLNNHPDGANILTGIGFRIPTQGMNSIEVFKVKGFLPEEMGDAIVVPSEITTKSGSDFDIDKLNTYLKNIYVDPITKEIAAVPYYGIGQEAKNKLMEFVDGKFNTSQEAAKYLLSLEDIPTDTRTTDEIVEELYTQSLENEYFNSMQRLLQNPNNFKRLVTPNSTGILPELANKLMSAAGDASEQNNNQLLDRNYLSNLRHLFLMGKAWVGIGAVNNTGHAIAQKSVIYINNGNISNLPASDKYFLGNGDILLPHNKVDVQSGNVRRSVATLSGTTNIRKEYISDSLSAYLNAFVDIAKDPFIMKIIYSDKLVSTFMLLERLGVPTEYIGFFMHQPAIKEYIKYLDIQGRKGIFQTTKFINEYLDNYFPASEYASKIELGSLSSNISDYYRDKKKFNERQNMQQQLIFREFLKYSKMAEYLFDFTQAYNYDTTSFRSSDILFKKQLKTEASDASIFSSAQELMKNSFLGVSAKYLDKSSALMGELMIFQKPFIRNILNKVIEPYANMKYMSADDYQAIGNKVVTSFLDYLVQTNTGLNNNINTLMTSSTTSLVSQIAEARKLLPENQFLQDIQLVVGDEPGSVSYIKIKAAKDSYSQNLYTSYLKEIRDISSMSDDPILKTLYGNILRVGLLQGIGYSPISFTDLIPVEDYAKALAPVITTLDSNDSLSNFYEYNMFQRNNWEDDTIVPKYAPAFFLDDWGDVSEVTGFNTNPDGTPDLSTLYLNEVYNQRYLSFPILKVKRWTKFKGVTIDLFTGKRISPQDVKRVQQTKDRSPQSYYGYEQVKDEMGNPVYNEVFDKRENRNVKYYMYKATNLWGDSFRAQEYYKVPQSSVINNNTVKVTDSPKVSTSKTLPTDEINEVLNQKDKGC